MKEKIMQELQAVVNALNTISVSGKETWANWAGPFPCWKTSLGSFPTPK